MTFFQYYLLTKDSLPLDIDFIVQDSYALVRPQWKIVTDLGEAARHFSDAVSANYQQPGLEKATEVDEDADDSTSDDLVGEDGLPEVEERHSSSDDDEVLSMA